MTVLLVASALAAGCGRGCRPAERPPPAPKVSGAAPAANGRPAAAATNDVAGARAVGVPASAPVATTASGLRRVPACTLVSRREVQEILESPIGRPMPEQSDGTTGCTYPPSQVGHSNQAHVTIAWDSPRTGPSMAHQLAYAGRGTEPGPQVAQHVDLGDEADWSLDGELSVRSGPTLITVEVGMGPESRRQTEAIARKILERLRGGTMPDLTDTGPEDADDAVPKVDHLLGAVKVH